MRMKMRSLIFALVASGLASCSTPMTIPDPPTMQTRAEWLKDWDRMAADAASDFLIHYSGDKSSVFVMPVQRDLAFASAYRTLLQEKLLDGGITVSESAIHARTVLTFDVQSFLYDCQDALPDLPLVLNDTQFSSDCKKRVVPAVWTLVPAIFDDLASVYNASRAEVLLTLTVSDGEYLRYQKTTEFYIRPADLAAFYQSAKERHENFPQEGHWLNGNRAASVWAQWPEQWDNLPGPEKAQMMGADALSVQR